MTEEKFVTTTQEEPAAKEAAMVMTLGDRIRKSGEKKGKEQGILIGELKGKLLALREMFGEGILTREQYHAKAEPIQAKLDALLAKAETEKA